MRASNGVGLLLFCVVVGMMFYYHEWEMTESAARMAKMENNFDSSMKTLLDLLQAWTTQQSKRKHLVEEPEQLLSSRCSMRDLASQDRLIVAVRALQDTTFLERLGSHSTPMSNSLSQKPPPGVHPLPEATNPPPLS